MTAAKSIGALLGDIRDTILQKYGILTRRFTERRQLPCGNHLVECKDLDEALASATCIPTLSVRGTIKVRLFESIHENDVSASC